MSKFNEKIASDYIFKAWDFLPDAERNPRGYINGINDIENRLQSYKHFTGCVHPVENYLNEYNKTL
jgi:hypothetical protein